MQRTDEERDEALDVGVAPLQRRQRVGRGHVGRREEGGRLLVGVGLGQGVLGCVERLEDLFVLFRCCFVPGCLLEWRWWSCFAVVCVGGGGLPPPCRVLRVPMRTKPLLSNAPESTLFQTLTLVTQPSSPPSATAQTHLLERPVLADRLERAHRPDAADVGRVVAAAHDAEVDELRLRQSEALQRDVERELLDRLVGGRRRHEVADDAVFVVLCVVLCAVVLCGLRWLFRLFRLRRTGAERGALSGDTRRHYCAAASLCPSSPLSPHPSPLSHPHPFRPPRRAKREAVHVLRRDAVHQARLGHDRALRLGLGRRVDDGHAHQLQQALALVVVLARDLRVMMAVVVIVCLFVFCVLLVLF